MSFIAQPYKRTRGWQACRAAPWLRRMNAPTPLAWNGHSVPELLALELLDLNLFRNRFNQRNANNALFGGQILAQALTAATATADPARLVHSLHGYFLRAGRADLPVLFHVERTRDGGRFSTRRVTAVQAGQPIFHMECGFHAPEPGHDHQASLPPGTPGPEALPNLSELAATLGPRLPDWLRRRWESPERPIEVKPLDPDSFMNAQPGIPPRRAVWMRLHSATAAPDGPDQACLLAYLSDYWLAGTAALPHTRPMPSPTLFMASLDHAMWFHRPARADEWLLFDTDSPTAQAGRGLARGTIVAQNGTLVASTIQEALLRPVAEKTA
jgi:acyl-CoA thioesterase-2